MENVFLLSGCPESDPYQGDDLHTAAHRSGRHDHALELSQRHDHQEGGYRYGIRSPHPPPLLIASWTRRQDMFKSRKTENFKQAEQ